MTPITADLQRPDGDAAAPADSTPIGPLRTFEDVEAARLYAESLRSRSAHARAAYKRLVRRCDTDDSTLAAARELASHLTLRRTRVLEAIYDHSNACALLTAYYPAEPSEAELRANADREAFFAAARDTALIEP
ncbi:hypothetical protein M3B61_10805 [Micrococcus luteus]|nr:hypothetical protein [Micrococcus luteus]MCV7584351.1 hypothetical protein [Micrococcus luteus]MCV7589046.1 hypothetical protein [Micrococcus luteus]